MSKPIDQEREVPQFIDAGKFIDWVWDVREQRNNLAAENARLVAELEQTRAAVQPAGVAVPEGFRVMRPTSAALRDGDRWEVYGPSGGGIVSTHDVKDWLVRELLDALAAPHPVSGEQTADQHNAAYWQEQYALLRKDYQRTLDERAQDVADLVRAAEFARVDICSWIDKYPDSSHFNANRAIKYLDQALAAHRAQQGEQT